MTENTHRGTLGELLTQIRLFQHGVQASPPIKDSGNDLIAIRGDCFRAVQVKTRKEEPFGIGDLPDRYHILALVHVVSSGDELHLDQSRVFLVPREVVESRVIRRFSDVGDFLITRDLVEQLFA